MVLYQYNKLHIQYPKSYTLYTRRNITKVFEDGSMWLDGGLKTIYKDNIGLDYFETIESLQKVYKKQSRLYYIKEIKYSIKLLYKNIIALIKTI